MKAYNRERVIRRFQVPEEAWPVLEEILNETELFVLDDLEKEHFSKEELCGYLVRTEIAGDEKAAEEWIRRAWKRGVLWLEADGSYCIGSFYGRLDIFAVEERERYHALPRERKEALDGWYFASYVQGLQDGKDRKLPTGDRVLTLKQALAFVDGREDTPYLADCDCRVLKEGCASPVNTCITYRTAENSFARKGLAVPITKEEAKDVIRKADAAGLMHTANPGGVCNCCGDCCYLFRASEELGLWQTWPVPAGRIQVKDTCIGCGRCVERCYFEVLKLTDVDGGRKRIAVAGADQCVGCGICRAVCPVGALELPEEEQ